MSLQTLRDNLARTERYGKFEKRVREQLDFENKDEFGNHGLRLCKARPGKAAV